jgi:hypothetical protein
MTPLQVKKEEELITNWLKSIGYFRVRKSTESAYFEADGGMRQIIVLVSHGERIDPSENNIKKFVATATSQRREPWIAAIHSDKRGHSKERIEWLELSDLK